MKPPVTFVAALIATTTIGAIEGSPPPVYSTPQVPTQSASTIRVVGEEKPARDQTVDFEVIKGS
jgi:hypothetical protein